MLTKKGKALLSAIHTAQDRAYRAENLKLKRGAEKWAKKRISELTKQIKGKDPDEAISILNPSKAKLSPYELMQIDAFCELLGIKGLLRRTSNNEIASFTVFRELTISIRDLRELLLAAEEDLNS